MQRNKRLAPKSKLAKFPFEGHGEKVIWEHSCAYVKRFLMEKVTKGHFATWVNPRWTIDVNQIFLETPKNTKPPFKDDNPDSFNPYALYLDDPVIRKLLTEV